MAGIAVPTAFLLWIMMAYALTSDCLEVPSQFVFALPARPLARALVFPMALVPNIWGVWNMLYAAVRPREGWSLAVHGAVPVVPIGMAVYYLAWKYLVGFLNKEMGIA
jgi:hypothetical protein